MTFVIFIIKLNVSLDPSFVDCVLDARTNIWRGRKDQPIFDTGEDYADIQADYVIEDM